MENSFGQNLLTLLEIPFIYEQTIDIDCGIKLPKYYLPKENLYIEFCTSFVKINEKRLSELDSLALSSHNIILFEINDVYNYNILSPNLAINNDDSENAFIDILQNGRIAECTCCGNFWVVGQSDENNTTWAKKLSTENECVNTSLDLDSDNVYQILEFLEGNIKSH